MRGTCLVLQDDNSFNEQMTFGADDGIIAVENGSVTSDMLIKF